MKRTFLLSLAYLFLFVTCFGYEDFYESTYQKPQYKVCFKPPCAPETKSQSSFQFFGIARAIKQICPD